MLKIALWNGEWAMSDRRYTPLDLKIDSLKSISIYNNIIMFSII